MLLLLVLLFIYCSDFSVPTITIKDADVDTRVSIDTDLLTPERWKDGKKD